MQFCGVNKRRGKCPCCGLYVEPTRGYLLINKRSGAWVTYHRACAYRSDNVRPVLKAKR